MKLFKTIETSFENFDDTINSYLSKAFNSLGLQYSNTQIFGIIFNGMKGIMENIMFYIEDALTEQNVFKASRKQSVYSLAKISGFEAYYGSAASGILLGKLQINNGLDSKTTKVYINNHTTVMNRNSGLIYSIILPTNVYSFDVSKPLMTHEFKIVQGVFENFTYAAQGNSLETVHCSTLQLFDRQYIIVKVNGEEWTEVGNLYDMTENGHEYFINIGYDNAFDVIFGNETYGTMLNEGDIVNIEYLKHTGENGNISSTENYDFRFREYGFDTLSNQVNINDYMTLSVSTCISGGKQSDSIEFIRNMIGTNSRSLVLASEDNFRLFFKRFSFIGYISCWTESNSMVMNVICLTNVKNQIKDIEDYFKIKDSELLLSTEQKEMVCNTLENSKKSFAGISIQFKDPIIRKYAIMCYVKADSTYNKDTIKSSIRRTLCEYFVNLKDSTQFIAKSELISLCIANCENILSLDIDIISETAEKAFYDNYYIKYEIESHNGTYHYVPVKHIYESSDLPGLDSIGNIQVDSKMEVPILHGGFKIYPDKSDKINGKKNSIIAKDIDILFI